MITTEIIARFGSLFRGNMRSYGAYMPNAKTKMLTIKAPFSAENVRSHLEGEQGLGVVPIMDDHNCWWAAIDIDIHGPAGSAVDLISIEQKVTRGELPLIVCRSKSGGAHCYLFLREAAPASTVRAVLGRWAGVLGYAAAEIFPKQTNLIKPPS